MVIGIVGIEKCIGNKNTEVFYLFLYEIKAVILSLWMSGGELLSKTIPKKY